MPECRYAVLNQEIEAAKKKCYADLIPDFLATLSNNNWRCQGNVLRRV